jgi:molybdate transport system permease protein
VIGRRHRRGGASTGTPPLLIPPAAIGAALLVVPAVALVVRAPWSKLGAIYREYQFWDALRLSIETSLEATLLSVVLGVPLAWILARRTFPGRSLLRAAVTLPLVLPPVVGGIALFFALGQHGLVGQYLYRWFGWSLPFTQFGIVLAATFVSMPFLIVTVEGALRSSDRGLEEAAATLGASRWRVFTRVTLPLITPSLALGSVLCWARAIGEFGATTIFGGNIAGSTLTMPVLVLRVFQVSGDPAAATALSLPLMLVAIVVLVTLRDKWLLRTAPVS